MAGWIGWTAYAAGLLAAGGLGYRVGLARGRRRERRARTLDDRLQTAIADPGDRRPAAPEPLSADPTPLRSDAPGAP